MDLAYLNNARQVDARAYTNPLWHKESSSDLF